MINISVQVDGALFNGVLRHALAEAIDETKQEIAEVGANHLRDDLGVPPFKNPTGFYRSNVTQKKLGESWVVWDSGVVYGPWLAGTGSRNATSRFKGYAHWRRGVQYLNKVAKPTAEKIINRVIRRYA